MTHNDKKVYVKTYAIRMTELFFKLLVLYAIFKILSFEQLITYSSGMLLVSLSVGFGNLAIEKQYLIETPAGHSLDDSQTLFYGAITILIFIILIIPYQHMGEVIFDIPELLLFLTLSLFTSLTNLLYLVNYSLNPSVKLQIIVSTARVFGSICILSIGLMDITSIEILFLPMVVIEFSVILLSFNHYRNYKKYSIKRRRLILYSFVSKILNINTLMYIVSNSIARDIMPAYHFASRANAANPLFILKNLIFRSIVRDQRYILHFILFSIIFQSTMIYALSLLIGIDRDISKWLLPIVAILISYNIQSILESYYLSKKRENLFLLIMAIIFSCSYFLVAHLS